MSKVKKLSKAKKQETHLPLLMQVDSGETGGLIRFTDFNTKDFIERLKRALLEHPEFRPPFTTDDMPACIVDIDCKVEPKRNLRFGMPQEYRFTLHIDIVPGNQVYDYEREPKY